MVTERTRIALGQLGGTIYLLADREGIRPHLYDEDGCEDHPFLKFANASNLPELMVAMDEIYGIYGPDVDFIDSRGGFQAPERVDESMARQIAELFEEEPSRRTIEKTRSAISQWDVASIGPGEYARHDLESFGAESFIATPLIDVITAAKDLRRHCLLYAWLVGKTDFATAHGMDPADRRVKFKGLDLKGDSDLSQYYRDLCEAPANKWARMSINFGSFEQMHLFHPDQIERDVVNYVRCVFAVLLSDTTIKMDKLMHPVTTPNTIVSAAWKFFAEGIDKDAGPGAISVCENCGKLFERRRNTKRFCTDSCRVIAKRKPAEESKYEYYVTNIAKQREMEQ